MSLLYPSVRERNSLGLGSTPAMGNIAWSGDYLDSSIQLGRQISGFLVKHSTLRSAVQIMYKFELTWGVSVEQFARCDYSCGCGVIHSKYTAMACVFPDPATRRAHRCSGMSVARLLLLSLMMGTCHFVLCVSSMLQLTAEDREKDG